MLTAKILFLLLTLLDLHNSSIHKKQSKRVHSHRSLQTSPPVTPTPNIPANATSNTTNTTSSNTTNTTSPLIAPGKCHPKLLQAFSLSGPETPIKLTLDFCPLIINSCCTLPDQNQMFNNWVTLQESTNLDLKMQNFTSLVSQFLQVAANVTKLVSIMMNSTTGMKNNECVLMGRRILTYQIEDSTPLLNIMFNQTYSFMQTSYKGFYCAICNADNGQYIQRDAKKILISENYCRNIVSQTLPSVMYLKLHIPKYMNLLTAFVSNCNMSITFNKTDLPSGIFNIIDPTLDTSLTTCFKQRNLNGWLEPCLPICNAFQIGQVNPLFIPDFSSYNATIGYLAQAIIMFGNSTNSTGNTTDNTNTTTSATKPALTGRVLSSKLKTHSSAISKHHKLNHKNKHLLKTSKKQIKSRKLQLNPTTPVVIDPYAPPIFISVNSTSDIALETWVSEVRTSGLELYFEGSFANITGSTLNSVRAVLRMRKLKGRMQKSRKLKSDKIFGTLMGVLFILFFKN